MKKKTVEEEPRGRGRPKIPGIKPMSLRITDEQRKRMVALVGERNMTEFIREAISRELARREKR